MKKGNIVQERSFEFALDIIKLYKHLKDSYKEFVLSRQILKSGTSIGAQIKESEFAESKLDFIHKMSIALKEASETEYWLDLLNKSEYINTSLHDDLKSKCTVIIKLLISIVNTAKNNV